VKAQLDEGFLIDSQHLQSRTWQRAGSAYLLMDVELPENLSRIQQVSVLEDPMYILARFNSWTKVRGCKLTSWHSIPREAG
jgi:uncharacterized lipoprotein YmbA